MVAQRAALGGGGRISPSGRKHSSRLWWAGASSCRHPRRMPAREGEARSQLEYTASQLKLPSTRSTKSQGSSKSLCRV